MMKLEIIKTIMEERLMTIVPVGATPMSGKDGYAYFT